MTQFIDTLVGIFQSSGFAQFGQPGGWLYAVMICVGCFLLYLAIVKEFEPLILLPSKGYPLRSMLQHHPLA